MDQSKDKDFVQKKRRKKKDKKKEKYINQGKYNNKHIRITKIIK